MDTEKYTTISVSKPLKKRLKRIGKFTHRSVPKQLEHWAELEEARLGLVNSIVDGEHVDQAQSKNWK